MVELSDTRIISAGGSVDVNSSETQTNRRESFLIQATI